MLSKLGGQGLVKYLKIIMCYAVKTLLASQKRHFLIYLATSKKQSKTQKQKQKQKQTNTKTKSKTKTKTKTKSKKKT